MGEHSLIEAQWYVLRTDGPGVIICIYCYNHHQYYYYYYYYTTTAATTNTNDNNKSQNR